MAVFFYGRKTHVRLVPSGGGPWERGRLGPGACLLPSHMQEDVTGLRKGTQRLRDGSALQG